MTDINETDPEFSAFFTAFATGESIGDNALPVTDRYLYQLGALVAVGALAPFREHLVSALDADVAPVQVKEVVYQAAAYAGGARAIAFLGVTNEVLTERGVALPLPGQSTTTPEHRMEVGTAKQKEAVGSDNVDAMYANALPDTLRFQRFLSGNCFGDYYTRTGLDIRQRELLTFAVLVGLGGADNQTKAHVVANLRVGNTRAQLIDVLAALVAWIGYPRTLNGLAAVNDAAPAA
jgi:4-carboxymuconolactone decarboxylase